MIPAILARWTPEFVEAAAVRAGERVLDLACGTGIVTRQLANRVIQTRRVVGIDVNASMLATGRAAAPGVPADWVQGNAMTMPLRDAAFDLVMCQQGLQFIPDKLAAFREIRRVLVPGGRLVLSVWRSIENAPGFRVLEEALIRRIGAVQATLPPFTLGDGQAIRSLLMSAGFREARIRAEVKLSRWKSAEHFVRSLLGGAPAMLEALARQGPDVLDTIVLEVAEATRSYLDDDGWATPQTANIITAVT